MMTEISSLLYYFTPHHEPSRPTTYNRLFCFNLTTGETRRSKLEGLFKDDDKANSSVKICGCLKNLLHSVESDFFRHDEGENSGEDSQTDTAVAMVSQWKSLVGDKFSRKILHLATPNHRIFDDHQLDFLLQILAIVSALGLVTLTSKGKDECTEAKS